MIVPFATVEWNHELANDTRSLTAKYTNDPNNNFFAIPTDDPDRNYATASIGLSALFRNGFSAFATFNTVEGLRDVRNRGRGGGAAQGVLSGARSGPGGGDGARPGGPAAARQ